VRSIDRPTPAVQDSPIGVRPRREVAGPPAGPRPLPPRAPWVIRTPLDSLDARTMTVRDPDGRTRPLSVRERLMLLILDGHCRNRSYCWVGNAELAAAYGCEERTLQEILKEMEDDGLLKRVLTDRGRRGRVGIVLRRRADPDLPVADTDRLLALAIASLKDQREAAQEQRRGARKTAPSARGKPRPPSTRKTAPELRSLSWNENGSEKDGPRPGSESPDLRPRPEPAAGAWEPCDAPSPAASVAVALPTSTRVIEAPVAGPAPPIIPAPAPAEPAPSVPAHHPAAIGSPGDRAVPGAAPDAVAPPAPARVIEAPVAEPAPPIAPAPAPSPVPSSLPASALVSEGCGRPAGPAPSASPPYPAAAGSPDDRAALEAWLSRPPHDPLHRAALRRLGLPEGAPAAPAPAAPRDCGRALKATGDPEADFLAGLSPDLRAKFEALSEARRADLLYAARRHPDRARRRLAEGPDPRDRPPDPLAGASMEVRIEAMGTWRGRNGPLAPMLARALMIELETEEAYWPLFYKLCREVEAGARAAGCLIAARRQALGPHARASSKVFRAAVRNWDQEHPGPAHPD
jgi:DNA-binding Lrp family transcriptional regulator